MSNRIHNYIGMRVRYSKPQASTRNGWVGTLVNVKREGQMLKGVVEWDQTGEETPYQVTAFGFDRQGRGREPEGESQYLFFESPEEESDAPLYIVAGENGGAPIRVRGAEHALKVAKRKAAESKSGQGYIVFSPKYKAIRQDPPVVVNPVED